MKHARRLAGLIAFLFMALTACPLAAAAESPAGWAQVVERITTALVDQAPPDVVRAAFQDRYVARTFDGREATLEGLASMSAGVDWARPLSYATTPDSLAADLASLIADAPMSESVKRYLTPVDDLSMRQANVTGIKWIGQQLKARPDQPVGVIVMHRPAAAESSTATAAARPGTLVVAMVAGEMVGKDMYRIRQIAFGEFKLK